MCKAGLLATPLRACLPASDEVMGGPLGTAVEVMDRMEEIGRREQRSRV